MKLFFKLMLVILPFFAIIVLFAYLTNNDITFVGYVQRITSADFSIVDNAKSAMDLLVNNITNTDLSSFDFGNIFNVFGSVLALPFVFIYYLGTVLIASIGIVSLLIPF